jgi:hypothetical protein
MKSLRKQSLRAVCNSLVPNADMAHWGRLAIGLLALMVLLHPLRAGLAADPSADSQTVTASFSDVPPTHWAFGYIEALYRQGYVSGCDQNPLRYCPEQALTRSEIAVFITRGEYGLEYPPAEPSSPPFDDVPTGTWYAKWVQVLKDDGFTAGCSLDGQNYCPEAAHTRAEGTVMFLRMVHGPDYTPPPASGLFADVSLNTWSAPWIEAAYQADLIDACSTSPALLFCPEAPLDRASAAVMMGKANNLEPIANDSDILYGVWGMREEVYSQATQDLSANTVLTIFPLGSSLSSWQSSYETAIQENLQLIVGLNPVPYHWVEPGGALDNFPEQNPDGYWDLSQAQPFFDWLNSNPAYKARTLALYIRDEPFWPGPWRTWCMFWSTHQMTRLKEALQVALPGIPTYYDMGSAAPWEDRNDGSSRDCYIGRTEITDEAFDYLAIYRPPFREGEPYDQALTLQIVNENATLRQEKNLAIQFIYLGSSYQFEPTGYRMPTAAEIRQIGCDVLGSGQVEGMLWYPWQMYTESLGDRPDLFDDVVWVAENCLP